MSRGSFQEAKELNFDPVTEENGLRNLAVFNTLKFEKESYLNP